MKRILYLILLLIAVSCSNVDEFNEKINHNRFVISNYHYSYANYSTTIFPNNNSDNLVKFIYDEDGKIIKRIGDIFYYSLNSGFGPVISDSLFTNLDYYDNKIKLTKGISYLGFSTLENESIVTVDLQGKMIKKTNRYQTNTGLVKFDTINYNYENNKLISFIKTSNESGSDFDIRKFDESTLYYNATENLDSVVTISTMKYSDTPYIILLSKKTEIFEGYDNSFNPFKELTIFEETFYRSISNNNFRKFTEQSNQYHYPEFDFYSEPIALPTTIDKIQSWILNYDDNGNWIYNQI